MNKVLICAASSYYGKESDDVTNIDGSWDLDNLNAGNLAAFDPSIQEATDLVAADGSNIVGKEIFFAVGRSEGGELRSPLVNKESLAYYKKEYSAPVAKVMTYGKSGAIITFPTLAAGQIFGFIVVDLDKPVEDTSRFHRIEHVVTAAEAAGTDAALCTAIAADMNGDTEVAKLIATTIYNSDDGFVFTAQTISGMGLHTHNFHIIPIGQFVDNATASVAITTNHSTGFGTPQQVLEEEKIDWTERGKNTHHSGLQEGLWEVDSLVSSSATYTGFALTWKAAKSARRQTIDTEGNFNQNLMIYVPSGESALITTIEAILTALTS